MSVKRSVASLAILAASTLALTACGGSSDPAGSDIGDSGDTVTFTWDRNVAGEDEEPEYETTTTEVPINPETVVAFDMASLDTVGALGGEVTGAPLESVPDYLSGYLAEDAFNAGSLFEADLVEIEAHQPDLIIIGGRSAGLYEDLSEIAPTVDVSASGSYLDTLERNTTFLGQVLDAEDEAAAAVADLEAQIEDARATVEDVGTGLGLMVSGGSLSALAPAGPEPEGRNYRGGIIYDVFGVTPVVEDVHGATHGEPVSFEFLLEHDPDFLWVVDRDAATGAEDAQPAAAVLDNEIVHETTADQAGQIVYLDPVAWYIVFGGLDTTQIMIDDVVSAVN